MTTPAVSRHFTRVRGGEYLFTVNGVVSSHRFSTNAVFRVDQERPVSVSTVKQSDGYRPATGWSHSYIFEPRYLDSVTWSKQFRYGSANYYQYYRTDGFLQFGYYPRISYDETLVARAVNGALEKLKAQKVNLGVMFGERKQTAALFVDTIENIARSIRKFKRVNPRDWQKVVRGSKPRGIRNSRIPAKWLELQYGWKPAMSDLYGACEALAYRELDGDRYHITVTKMVGTQTIRTFTNSFDTSGYDLDWKDRTDLGASISLTYDMDNSFVRSLAQAGVTNPLEIIWELTPYSFVLDWALPIGEWLGLMDAATGWSFRGGSISRLRKEFSVPYCTRKARKGNDPGYETTRVEGLDRIKRIAWGFTRTVLYSSPLPRIYLKNPVSLGHVANATALLATALTGQKPKIRR